MIREFGEFRLDVSYVLRPGGYAVAVREDGMVAVVATPQGYFLPGGGQEKGESPREAAIREAYEECGMQIRVLDMLGVADQLAYEASNETYYRKRCTFFTAQPLRQDGSGEDEHQLLWLSPDVASNTLSHESQRWAVAEVCRSTKATDGRSRFAD